MRFNVVQIMALFLQSESPIPVHRSVEPTSLFIGVDSVQILLSVVYRQPCWEGAMVRNGIKRGELLLSVEGNKNVG